MLFWTSGSTGQKSTFTLFLLPLTFKGVNN
jgi:hypothetical protein